MDAAVEPTQQERDLYYHGIPSRPKLVARSSPEPWVLVQSEWSGPRRKAMYAVGDHPIVAIWNDDASTSLRAQVIDLLSKRDVNWHAIDVLRIGYREAPNDAPVVVFISVERDSLTWERGHAVAVQCRLLLLQYELSDVHCEIKESRLVYLRSPKVMQLPNQTAMYGDIRSLLCDVVGNTIGAQDTPTKEGTSCIYLRDTGTNSVFALTCRHVCFGPTETAEIIPGTAPSGSSSASAMKKHILQPGDGSHHKLLTQLQNNKGMHLEKFMELEQQLALCRDDDRIMRKFQFQKSMLNDIEPVITEYRDRTQPDASH